jgi:signal transduction histidine kinase
MPLSPAEYLSALDRGFDLFEGVLQKTRDLGERALCGADALRSLAPDALFCGCRLTRDGQTRTAIVDRAGAEQSNAMLDQLAASQAVEAPAREVRRDGQRWLVQEIVSGERRHGFLALALPERTEAATQAQTLLAVFARHLAVRLDLEAAQSERTALQAALDELSGLANLGVLASPVTHEFNNFLNVVLLQVAVLEQEVSGVRRDEFGVIRQQGKNVAELVRLWQQHRHRQRAGSRPTDLNALIRETVEAISREEPGFGETRIGPATADGRIPAKTGVSVRLSLGADLPPVFGTGVALQRLLRFLVTNAAAAITSLPGVISIRTALAAGKVVLTVEDTGPTVAPELLPQFFEPLVFAREGSNRLELAACQTLAQRHLQGGIIAENRPGGLAVVVTLKPFA